MPNIRDVKRQYRYRDKRCEVCTRGTGGIANLCRIHRYRRNQLGSVKVSRMLRHRDYAHLIGLAVQYMKEHPPTPEIIASIERFLSPPGLGIRPTRRQRLLVAEMSRWSDSRYQKKVTDFGQWSRRADYSPRGILAVLVAVKAFVEEREGTGFPHESEDIAMAFALVRLWKRPRGYSNGPLGRKAPIKFTTRTSKTVLYELVRRWRDFTMLNTFVLLTARTILTEYQAAEAERIAKLPKTYSKEEMRVLYERQQQAQAAKKFEEERAAFLAETPVPDPGPRTFGAWDGTAEMRARIMAWSEAADRYNNYERRRKKYAP